MNVAWLVQEKRNTEVSQEKAADTDPNSLHSLIQLMKGHNKVPQHLDNLEQFSSFAILCSVVCVTDVVSSVIYTDLSRICFIS